MSTKSDDSMLFPQKLMDILADPLNQATISWLPDGKAFVIRDRSLFAETVMPRYFPRKAKYSSFTRKLNRWNFMRVANGPEPGAYFHKYFLRDQPQLAAQMFCKNARTMLAMKSNVSIPLPHAEEVPVAKASAQFPALSIDAWSMKMNRNSAFQGSFSKAAIDATATPQSVAMNNQALLMQQEKEQLNRMLIDRALRLQQRSSVMMQQDRLLQMRRMIEMNMHQHRLQQQKAMSQLQGDGNDTARLAIKNRASAA